MSRSVTLSMPEELYLQVEQRATETQREIPEILLETIAQTFASHPEHPQRATMKQEIAAYEVLHPKLIKLYLGEYVAIYQGDLVDHDPDPVALHQRIKEKYAGKVVLHCQVQQEAAPILHMRSPRIEPL